MPNFNRLVFRKRYLLDFIVVFLGVTLSFSLSEWNTHRTLKKEHKQDVLDILEDLQQDSIRLSLVQNDLSEGWGNVTNVLELSRNFHDMRIDRDRFVDSLSAFGQLYSYSTFFLNEATYKGVLANNRIQLFPRPLSKKIRDYYELVAARVEDNNMMIDQVCRAYYDDFHPYDNFIFSPGDERLPNFAERLAFFNMPGMRERYESLDFFNQTLALKACILTHQNLVDDYRQLRVELASAMAEYQRSLDN